MTNRELRKALLVQLDISPRVLSYRVKKIKSKNSMTTEDATYVIAQQEGIILDKYLDKDTVDRIMDIMYHISSITTTQSQTIPTKRKKRKAEKGRRVIEISGEFKDTDPILPQNKLSEAKEMAKIYPFIYVLENSIREVIYRVMNSKYGENWWDIHAPRKLKDDVAGRMAEDEKDSWHQRRSNHPIDYVDLNDLPRLVRKIEREIVPNIIPDIQWFSEMVKEVYKSRCVLCHMNPLDKDNIQIVKLRYKQWQKQIKVKKDLI